MENQIDLTDKLVDKFLNETPREEVEALFKKIDDMDIQGPTVDEYINNIKLLPSERIEDVKGFEGRFMITDHGRLFSINGKWKGVKLLVHAVDGPGYYNTTLRMKPKYKSIRIHQLVGEHFVYNPDNKPCLNHKDGNKLNNHYLNLEYVTIAENIKHAVRIGLIDKKGEKHHNSILKSHDIPQIIELRKMGLTHKNIGGMFGVSRQTIADVLRGSCWSHVSGL